MSAARTDALFRGASLTANPEETTTWLNLLEKKTSFFFNHDETMTDTISDGRNKKLFLYFFILPLFQLTRKGQS